MTIREHRLAQRWTDADSAGLSEDTLTNGSLFIMEAIIPPGGGPPLHIHHRVGSL